MKFFALFIYRPVATILLSVAITLCGILGFRMLPVAPLPQVDFPVIMVSASLPGASPETMASSVATPLETGISTAQRVMCRRRSTLHKVCCPVGCPAVRPIAKRTRRMRQL